ncbi:unnamed protein product [Adineta ricciae]|uniref:Protein kinase domain-containing protein n=1 Tax=Adineta ricciae TaxID=249248 RepID=A0A815NEY3_ADIRI|nr:unnamed protein product [Adineta ricciae]
MAYKNLTFDTQWIWQTNLNSFSPSEQKERSHYSKRFSEIIEKPNENKEHYLPFSDQTADLREGIQNNKNDSSKTRSGKQDEIKKESSLQLKEKLGEGGFGIVYKAIYHGSEIACKVVDSRLSKRTTKEINILQKLHHSNIVQYIDVIYTSKQTFIIMEYIDGSTLYDYSID